MTLVGSKLALVVAEWIWKRAIAVRHQGSEASLKQEPVNQPHREEVKACLLEQTQEDEESPQGRMFAV